MELELSGRVAVVTGASKGIGLAVVQTLVEEGARVVAASRTRTPALRELGSSVVHVGVDLTDPDAPAEVVARAVEAFGQLDILVNNAGGPPPGDTLPHAGFMDRSDDQWRAILDFNLMTAVRATRAALPLLLERDDAAIVNVSSVNGRQPAPVNVDYSASKAAMLNLTKALAAEFGPRGVRVNVVSPGATLTPWWTKPGGAAEVFAVAAGTDAEAVLATVVPEAMQLATGRLVTAQEVADAVAWLCSPRAASMHGAEIVVDGGFLKAL